MIRPSALALSILLAESALAGLAARSHANPTAQQLSSPDGKVEVRFHLQPGGVPVYSIDYFGTPIVLESRLGLLEQFINGFKLTATSSSKHSGWWTNDLGELRIVPDHYAELNAVLEHESGAQVQITFRAYDEGAALRYTFPDQEEKMFHLDGERTEFRFPEGTLGYEAHGTEGRYQLKDVREIQPFCERPLTLKFSSGLHASLAEAGDVAYPRMLLSPSSDTPGALVSALGGTTSNSERGNERHDPTARLAAGESTPWRVLVVGRTPGDLLERNYLALNLGPPSKITDSSWVKPGKVIREVTLSTAGGLECVDFAAEHGLQYVHFDAGWYGPEGSDPDASRVEPSRDLDLRRVIDYGASKGVGVILYVNRLALEEQIDILPALYHRWGVKGMKFGFVHVGSQEHTAWLMDAIRKCATNQIMVNVHDGYRATGNNRAWPNLMTVEGIRGNEHMPSPEHNCTLPFTRYVGGIGDYTICYYSNRIKTTHAHQLAMAVVSFSPLQWVFWYDRPSDYRGEPEVEFFEKVPTVWDETRVIHGEIGQYATIARRSGEDWFIGTINDGEPRRLELPLDFLAPGQTYMARVYFDDPSVKTRTNVGTETKRVDSTTVLDVPLFAGGGQAVWISSQ